MTSAIILPAALGLAILAGPILSVLFKWGLFGTEDVKLLLRFYVFRRRSSILTFLAFFGKSISFETKHDPSFASAIIMYVRKSHLQSDFDETLGLMDWHGRM